MRRMSKQTLETWHRLVRDRDMTLLDEVLADDIVFHSPVVHRPQAGKPLTKLYLAAAASVLGNDSFRYVREVVSDGHAVLEFQTEVDGIQINGVDMMQFDAQGRIQDFKVMVRPLKAINMVHGMMKSMLERMGG